MIGKGGEGLGWSNRGLKASSPIQMVAGHGVNLDREVRRG